MEEQLVSLVKSVRFDHISEYLQTVFICISLLLFREVALLCDVIVKMAAGAAISYDLMKPD